MNFIVVKNLFSTKSLFHFREFKKRERERKKLYREISNIKFRMNVCFIRYRLTDQLYCELHVFKFSNSTFSKIRTEQFTR